MLRAAEFTALFLLAMNVCAAFWVSSDTAEAELLKAPLLAGFVIFFLLVLLVVAHATPLAQARNPKTSPSDEQDGLPWRDVKTVLLLAPRIHRRIGIVGVAALASTIVGVGGVSWSSGSTFQQGHAFGIALYVSALTAIVLPVLAGLARLPPTVSERIALLKRNDA